ncbi:MAG: hypothetical protein LQ352_004073 [Teloschistes flavicans]|nr:MAG: hypothetical protein LQ352_004073 [Teloschistes flavicans]
MKRLHTIATSPNPNAIIALSPSSESCYLAYPLPYSIPPPNLTAPHAPHAPPTSTHIPPTTGEVLIFDALNLQAINVIQAHRSPLSCICLNNAGTLLATASDKGTIIRVFSIPSAKKLYQFRRGSIPSRIYSMAFNATSTLLCVSSASDTVHIFKLCPPSPSDHSLSTTSSTAKRKDSMDNTSLRPRSSNSSHNPEVIREESPAPSESQQGDTLSLTISNGAETASIPSSQRKSSGTLMGMIRRTSQNVSTSFAASVGAYLPTAVSEMWEPTRDFAWLKIPKSSSPLSDPGLSGQRTTSGGSGLGSTAPLKSVVAMSHNSPQVMVVTSEGRFYVFGIDLEKGGEGSLVKVYEVGAEADRMGMEEM